jgi:hypothetical protein
LGPATWSPVEIRLLRTAPAGQRRVGLPHRQDLHSIQGSPSSASGVTYQATTRLTLPGANASMRACAWRGCRSDECVSSAAAGLYSNKLEVGRGEISDRRCPKSISRGLGISVRTCATKCAPRAHTGRHRLALVHTCQTLWQSADASSQSSQQMSRAIAASWALMRSGTLKGLTERRAILDRIIAQHMPDVALSSASSTTRTSKCKEIESATLQVYRSIKPPSTNSSAPVV